MQAYAKIARLIGVTFPCSAWDVLFVPIMARRRVRRAQGEDGGEPRSAKREGQKQVHSELHDEERSDPRSNVFLTAVLCAGGASANVRIRNLSAHGALLEGPALPAQGTVVQIRRGSLSVAGDIAWSRDNHCGVRFAANIEVGAWIERAGPIGQQRIDAAIAEFRRQPSPPSAFAVLPGDFGRRPDMNSLSSEILRICERMVCLPELTVEIAEQILQIEAAARVIAIHEQPR